MDIVKGMQVRILPRQDGWEDEGPSYTDDMVDHEGEVFTVTEADEDSVYYRGYRWLNHWLEPLEMENV